MSLVHMLRIFRILSENLVNKKMKSKFRQILFILSLSFTVMAADEAMNVLFIIVDDLRPELGCYGVNYIKTPNIDKLASSGAIFKNAFVQQAVCSASRASFLTGLRPDSTGSDYPYSIYTVENLFEGDRPSIMRHFMRQGYYVRSIGKIHHGYNEDFSEKSFSSGYGTRYADESINYAEKAEKIPFERGLVDDQYYDDGKNTVEAISTLHRMAKQDKPFFLAMGYWKPHLPWNAPAKYWDLYNIQDIPLAHNPQHPENSPLFSTDYCNLQKYKLEESPNNLLVGDPRYAQKLKHAYAACVSYVDAQIGKLLDTLEELNLENQTMVVLISDHGWHLGEQNHWGKSTNFEYATRAPLIISAPGLVKRQEIDALVEYVDIYPTICDITGIDLPAYLEGISVLPLLLNPNREWKKAVFSQYPRGWPKTKFEGYSIRTKRYNYIQWRELDGTFISHELYDHKYDSCESVNIVDDPGHEDLIEDLKTQLTAGWKKALPDDIVNLSSNNLAPDFLPWGKEAAFGPHAARKNK